MQKTWQNFYKSSFAQLFKQKMPQGLEVEIKIRLEEKKDFELVKGKLGKYKQVQNQVNYYFDGSNKEMFVPYFIIFLWLVPA